MFTFALTVSWTVVSSPSSQCQLLRQPSRRGFIWKNRDPRWLPGAARSHGALLAQARGNPPLTWMNPAGGGVSTTGSALTEGFATRL